MNWAVIIVAICIGINAGYATVNFMDDRPAAGFLCLSMAAFCVFMLTLVS